MFEQRTCNLKYDGYTYVNTWHRPDKTGYVPTKIMIESAPLRAIKTKYKESYERYRRCCCYS